MYFNARQLSLDKFRGFRISTLRGLLLRDWIRKEKAKKGKLICYAIFSNFKRLLMQNMLKSAIFPYKIKGQM